MSEHDPQAPASSPGAVPPAAAGKPGALTRARRTLTSHFGLVIFVGIFLLLPLMLVNDLVDERSYLYRKVVQDISQTWGGPQQVTGPLLVLPFNNREITERVVRRDRDKEEIVKETQLVLSYLVVLPRDVNLDVSLDPQERQRGIYRSLVYTSALNMRGSFTLPTTTELKRVAPALDSVDYANAYVIMGLSYPSALRSVGDFIWNGVKVEAEPGTSPFSKLDAGYKIPAPLDAAISTYTFSQEITFNGSEGMRFTPTGVETVIKMTSPWPHPSFQGKVLPVEREITPQGFTAEWRIPSLARTYPNLGVLKAFPSKFENFNVGVDLYEMTTHYKLINRSVKYGILFISLTFLALIVFEMGLRVRLHPVQYGLVGLAMVVFYLVLLSLSEHMPFMPSYAAATACVVIMNGSYVGAAARSAKQGAGVGVLLTGLYTLLYAILQMEDYALLMGTGLVLVMLAALMVVSRHVNTEMN